MAVPESWGVLSRKHADMPALARASRPTRHGGKPPCRATPRADWFSTRASAASFVLPSAFALAGAAGSGGWWRCAASGQRAGERADGRRPGAFKARRLQWVDAPKAARSAARMRSLCTRDDTRNATGSTRLIAR